MVDSIEPDQRLDLAAVGIATGAHFVLLVIGAFIIFGDASETEQALTTTWSDGSTEISTSIEPVELIDEVAEKNRPIDPATSAVVARQTSVSNAATEASMDDRKQNGLGGAFFGSGTDRSGKYGKRIVYIVDASDSMNSAFMRSTRFSCVRTELENSIFSLHESQKFAVILFNENMRPVISAQLRNATNLNKTRIVSRIWKSGALGGTHPRASIRRALRMKPDTIYFLTDGRFPPGLAAELLKKNEGLTVHTFTLGDASGEAVMRRIAEANGGTYKFVGGSSASESTASTGNGNGLSNTP